MKFLALAAALAGPALAIQTVSVKGSKMYTADGNQWFMKGIAYQLTNDDPLAQPDQCARDAALMKTIGTNSIRVYHVDPSANHDECMTTFANAGIYTWIDLDTFSTYIWSTPTGPPTWTQAQYNAYAAVMDAFHKYDNVAGFFVGNEVMNSPESSVAAPFVKAAARDMKAYRDNKGYRNFPIGYTAADVAELRPMLQNYLACGDASDAIDVFGLNAYEWCGPVNFQTSGYAGLQKNASEYNIPIFFSETGCNQPLPRDFADQAAILGPDMDDTWSGAIIYEWIQEENSYGLISYGPPAASGANVVAGYTRVGTPTPLQPDFNNLSKQWATLTPKGTPASAYSPSLSAPPCPAFTSGAWSVQPNAPLPTIGQAYTGPQAVASYGPGTTTSSSSTSISSSSQASSSMTSSLSSSTTASSSIADSSTGTGTSGTPASAQTAGSTSMTSAASTSSGAAAQHTLAAALAFAPLIAFF